MLRLLLPIVVALAAHSAPALAAAEGREPAPASAPAPGAPSVRFGRPEILGSIPRELVLRHVQRRRAELVACYARHLAARPRLAGQVVVHFVISPDGRVQGATVARSTVGSRALERCVLAAVERWTFGHGPPGMNVIRLPLLFDPGRHEAAGS